MKHLSTLLLVTLAVCGFSSTGSYFGRNKVQYDLFDFKVLESENLKIHYYPSKQGVIEDVAKILERWNSRLEKIFPITLPSGQPVILYANHAHFQQTNTIMMHIPQSVGGVTEGLMNRVIVPLSAINSSDDHVLGHELVHAFQFELLRKNPGAMARLGELPLWFVEGMAEYLSIGSKHPMTAMWLRDALFHDDLPTVAELASPRHYFPYRYGHAVIAFIAGKGGDETVGQLFAAVARYGWLGGYRRALGVPVDTISAQWKKSTSDHFYPTLEGKTAPEKTGKQIIPENNLNISPAVSPDGSKMVYMSTGELFTIDLFLADAKTGRLKRKLLSSVGDDHFDALRFFNSSGAWSPDGKTVCVVVFREGRNDLAFLDVENGGMKRVQTVQGVEEITAIAYSPDGKSLALAGTNGAVGNLYLYHLQTGQVTQLTDDRYTVIQPSWSPDGEMLLFSTDRTTATNLDSLDFGPNGIGIYHLATGTVSTLSIAAWAKHTDPQFSPDGRSIYTVANPDGFSDIYRICLEDSSVYRISSVVTGVTGLTELSPAMSVAADSGTILFSVFNNAGFQIQRLEPHLLNGEPFTPDMNVYIRNVSLPPMARADSLVDNYLRAASEGVPEVHSFSINDYSPRLRLLYVGQLFAGVVADRYGVGVAGGASFVFSDLLGDHLLGIGAQINGRLSNTAAEAVYINQRRRLNWGLSLSRVPYVSTRFGRVQEVGPTDEYIFLRERIVENRIRTFMDYPFSQNRRIEFSSGFTRFGYDYAQERIRVENGMVIDQQTVDVEDPTSLSLFSSSAAYVGDFSLFGFTAPVRGRRFRLEMEPTVGSLQYLSVLGDYRQYLFLNPFTLAYRAFHYGRYLGDSESDRLSPLFVGLETWIRGYSPFTFDLRLYTDNYDFSDQPEFDRLIGTRVGVVNLELRLPLFGIENYGLINFPYLPLDLVAFFDGGVAWTRRSPPQMRWESDDPALRVPVFSAGGAARVNILGVLVLQIYYAYPFQRPDYGGHWGFIFAPGW